MLTFDRGNSRFNFRAVAVIMNEDKVLLHKAVQDDFWALPGGRVEFFETSSETLIRELKEELNIYASIQRPLWFVENFFNHLEKKYHEISTFFLLDIDPNSYIFGQKSFKGIEDNVELFFQWFSLEELSTTKLYPSFLRKKLSNLPVNLEYLVHRD